MRPIGQGRIVLWEGGSLWAFHVPAASGSRRSGEAHSHHALQLTFSVEGTFRFDVAGEWIDGPAVLIAPDVPHAYDPHGKNAIVFLDPESRAGSAALKKLGGKNAVRLDHGAFADLAQALAVVWADPRPADSVLVDLGRQAGLRLAEGTAPARPVDGRIVRVLDALSDVQARPTLRMAADLACLSESRFTHLFASEIGLPYRTYLLWRRLEIAVAHVATGASLTDAAHNANFADSAHFSRTFLRMFGVPASALLLL